MSDTHARSIAKAVSWRVVATIVTIVSVWALTGELGLAAASGGIAAVGNLIAYYLHERAWARVRWGVARPESGEAPAPERREIGRGGPGGGAA